MNKDVFLDTAQVGQIMVVIGNNEFRWLVDGNHSDQWLGVVNNNDQWLVVGTVGTVVTAIGCLEQWQ